MGYFDLKYKTPNDLKNKHMGKKFLILGSGHSVKNIIEYKKMINNVFDVVIGINLTTLEFEDNMNYHLIIEKNPKKMTDPMFNGQHKYRRDLPRVLNWKAIDKFPKDVFIYKTTRHGFNGAPNIREYVYNNMEGLMTGPLDSIGLAAGTGTMQAFHLAAVMGAKEIYLIGADLVFKNEYDHFYNDSLYRKSTTKKANRSPIVKVNHKGKVLETTEFFLNSAKFFDYVIENLCVNANIRVYDFSDGLISKATNLNTKEFFGG